MFPINPKLEECYSNMNISASDLKKVKIRYDTFWFKRKQSLYYFHPKIRVFDHVVAFDLDWTLSYNERHLFPKETTDIQILPNRRKVLEDLIKNGYTVVIFTNQFGKNADRVLTFLNKLKLPIFVYVATGKDSYRKPCIGMFTEFMHDIEIKINKLYFVGDALGRPQDFDDSDKKFAEKIGATILSPEEVFPPSKLPDLSPTGQVIIMVGPPGSGKTTFYRKYLKNQRFDFLHVNQDQLKTKQKVLSTLKMFLSTGKSIVIDSTNPDRSEYYKLIKEPYTITVLHFVRDGYGWNKLREGNKKVPDIVYHIYYKKFVPFSEDENIYKIWF